MQPNGENFIMHLREFLRTLRDTPRTEINRLSESQSRKKILEPILRNLGWNTDGLNAEVVEEFPLENRRVDYCLRIGRSSKVFIEAKKPSEKLGKHHRQLLEYSFTGGVEISILSNCIDWLFFLPLIPEPWARRQFDECNILNDDLSEVTQVFDRYLSRENTAGGHTNSFAREAMQLRLNENFVNDAFPETWRKLILKGDQRFIDFFSDIVEQDWGSRPTSSDVSQFLINKSKIYEPSETRNEKNRQKNDQRAFGSGSSRKPNIATGKRAIKRWNIPVIEARFHQDGHFYNTLQSFPAALCDLRGYIIFDTEDSYRNCRFLKIGPKKINVKSGKSISDIPGYVHAENPFSVGQM
jgi:hypothetical protein